MAAPKKKQRVTDDMKPQTGTCRKITQPWNFGGPTFRCQHCRALVWYEERIGKTSKQRQPKFGICCMNGKVQLSLLQQPPQPLEQLLKYKVDQTSTKFKENIRAYNSIFAFTSMGGNVDNRINNGGGPYVFRINGQNHHRIGSLLPPPTQKAKFAQLYIYDMENEVRNRMSAMNAISTSDNLDPTVIQEIIQMLDSNNQLARVFRMARDRFKENDLRSVRIRLLGSRSTDARQYDLPTASEVAGIIVGDLDGAQGHRDIIIEHKSEGLQRITELHPSYMAMQYPLLFPYGEDGFHLGIQYRTNPRKKETKCKTVTMREFYAFRIQQREGEGQTILHGGRLFHQYLVDAYTAVEEDRLRWVRLNQPRLRIEILSGVKDVVARGDTVPASVGKRIILPSSFTSGTRYMVQNYQDAMAICRWFGYPDLFITFTANPKWPEIHEFLNTIPGQGPEDRPEIECRVFKIKLDHLMRDITKGNHFGRAIAVVYTIEFQKKGLPHAHILLWLHPDDKYSTPDKIDKIISAEIPDEKEDPIGYEAVAQFMMHGPCGKAKERAPCMKNGDCTRHFPKNFYNETTIDEKGFAIYRRRDDSRTVSKGDIFLDNRFVVPHNLDLVVKYQAHINVEWFNKSKSIKYLFKYMNKGQDRAKAVIEENMNTNNQTGLQEATEVDEVKRYLDCRYLSACEACWRLFQFDVQYRTPAVERLPFHLPNEQCVTFRENDNLDKVLERVDIERNKFTQWMERNASDEDARQLTYAEFPTKWVWNQPARMWTKRKSQSKRCIGRIAYAHPASGEKYYLRLLLNIVKGARSFEDLKTVEGITYHTFKEACYALGLLDGDKEWHEALEEGSQWATGPQLRELFVLLLLFCEVSDPLELLEKHWQNLSDDVLYRQRQKLSYPELEMSESQIQNYCLFEIEKIMARNGRTLHDFPPMPMPEADLLEQLNNRLIREELSYNTDQLWTEHIQMFNCLNEQQAKIYQAVTGAVNNKEGGLFFVYGHGGTGKTFLYKTIIARLRSEGRIVVVVASSGIAALLLPGGRTVHSRFKIPLKLDENSVCNIHQGTQLAELIKKTDLIIWDEAPMDHRHAFEAVDRTLRDILSMEDINLEDRPFGEKPVLLGGDFRQILPVVPKGRREEIVDASISKSELWEHCTVLTLTRNMRLSENQEQSVSAGEIMTFGDWILSVGNGTAAAEPYEGDGEHSNLRIPANLLLPNSGHPIADMVRSTYPQILTNYRDTDYLRDRAILTPTNETVDEINDHILNKIPGNKKEYISADAVCKASSESEGQELLYPVEFLNTLQVPGIPNHRLELKEAVPVMLLRNLNQSAGLCNGTRLLITQTAKWVIEGKIISGSNIGRKVFIPRIIMTSCEEKWPFVLKRRQLPVKVCFAMTINKSQGQTLNNVGLYLPKPVFTHGQLYVALSRVTSRSGLKIIMESEGGQDKMQTRNIVYQEIFEKLHVI